MNEQNCVDSTKHVHVLFRSGLRKSDSVVVHVRLTSMSKRVQSEETNRVYFFFPQATHPCQCHVIPPASQ